MKVPFNIPYLTGKESSFISEALNSRNLSGNGSYTQLCQSFFEERYGFKKCLLTTSCTDALEMCALLIDIKPGDEVIMPSYTFVSTANAFALRGAKIVFADCEPKSPNLDASKLDSLINESTKAIVVVHYAGVSCNMETIKNIAEKNNIFVVEDAAQAIDSKYNDAPLGGIGHLGTFSFHETKNIISGEGGMLVINDERFLNRAEIIWEKGTNRSAFFRGEIESYGWVDIGSSFLPSETTAAFLYAQLLEIDDIQSRRKQIWERYNAAFTNINGPFEKHFLPEYGEQNGQLYYLKCASKEERNALISFLKSKEITAVFHYLPLHSSPYFKNQHDGRTLSNCDEFGDCLVRLPLFYDLKEDQQNYVIEAVIDFFN